VLLLDLLAESLAERLGAPLSRPSRTAIQYTADAGHPKREKPITITYGIGSRSLTAFLLCATDRKNSLVPIIAASHSSATLLGVLAP